MTSMQRVFRWRRMFWWLGCGIVGFGLILAAIPLYHGLSGVPLMVADGKSARPHVASQADLLEIGLWSLLISLCGAPLLVISKCAAVILDEQQLVIRGWIGQVTFSSPYREIDSVGQVSKGNKERFFTVAKGPKSVRVSDAFQDFEELWQEIIDRVNAAKTSG